MKNIGQFPGFVNWSALSREQFDALVESLLTRMYDDRSLWTVEVFRGDGGDGGRDVTVKSLVDGSIRIFQLKFFPGGFSAVNVKRREQIKKSFRKAMIHAPDEWTLVVPENTTAGEKTYLANLKSLAPPGVRSSLKLTEMTAANLISELAKFPDLRRSFEHDDWREFAAAFNVAPEILPSTPQEVEARFTKTQEAVDAADPDWTWVPTFGKGAPGRLLVAKSSRSAELSPIAIEIQTNPTALTPELERQLEAIFDFGLDGDIDLPPEVVERFSVVGPPIVAREEGGVRVLVSRLATAPASLREADIAVELHDGDDNLVWSHDASVEHAASGAAGYSLRLRLGKALRLTLKIRSPPRNVVSIGVHVDFEDASLIEIEDACAFLLTNSQEVAFRIVSINPETGSRDDFVLGELAGEMGGVESLNQVQYMMSLAQDLIIVQRHL